jgi:hypothetical protein
MLDVVEAWPAPALAPDAKAVVSDVLQYTTIRYIRSLAQLTIHVPELVATGSMIKELGWLQLMHS